MAADAADKTREQAAAQPGCCAESLNHVLMRLMAHGTAFNQFAQACMVKGSVGTLDADDLVEALEPMLGALRSHLFERTPEALDVRIEQWLQLWNQGLQSAGLAEAEGRDLDGLLEWRAALGDCQAHWVGLAETARGEFKARLQSLTDAGAPRLMTLYRHWCDAGEDSYQRMLRKPAFLRDHARLLNAALAVSIAMRRRGSEFNRRLGVPDHDELQRLIGELQQLRRRQRGSVDSGGGHGAT